MKFFIGEDGRVWKDIPLNAERPRLDLSFLNLKNEFEHKESAFLLRSILNQRYPRMFYGKIIGKNGL